jgi:Anti-sigma-D factor RsdA to sigma factor binding region
VRSGDIGDEAGRSAGDAGPLDLDAVRADDDLIEALSAGLVPPPSGARDTSDIEGELVALLAGWVADVRPETLLHRPEPPRPVVYAQARPESAENTSEDVEEEDVPVAALSSGTPSLLEHNELPRPVALSSWRSVATRPYLLRAAAALVAVALVSSGVVVRSYGAHPGEPLWVITQMAFPEKSHSVEAAISVSTGLNTARVALERGRVDEARQAFETVAAQLANVDPDDGRAELDHQMSYLNAQLAADPDATDAQEAPPIGPGQRPLATGAAGAVIPSGPAVTPGATTALDTPSTPPSVLAAGPDVTSEHSPAADGTSPAPPAEAAAPAPSGDALSAEPAPVDPPAGQASNGAPPVASDPVSDPAASGSTTTEQAAPTTEPQASHPTNDPATQSRTPDTVDTGTADQGNPTSEGHSTDTKSDGSGSGDKTDSGADSSTNDSTDGSTDGSADTKDKAIDTDGAAGSNPGQVTGVVTNTSDSGS